MSKYVCVCVYFFALIVFWGKLAKERENSSRREISCRIKGPQKEMLKKRDNLQEREILQRENLLFSFPNFFFSFFIPVAGEKWLILCG